MSRRLFDALVSQCGFRPDRLTVGWILGGVASLAIFLIVSRQHDLLVGAVYFAATSACYYLGNAWYLSRCSVGARRLVGDDATRAWGVYQCVVGLMFFNQALGFSAIASASFDGGSLPLASSVCMVVGGLLVAVGLVTKTWATLVVGVDCFYYKDLFFRRRFWPFTSRGPYRLLSCPMYGVGNLHVYGFAILSRSLPGLVAAALCHAAIYAFHYGLERPFVRHEHDEVGTASVL